VAENWRQQMLNHEKSPTLDLIREFMELQIYHFYKKPKLLEKHQELKATLDSLISLSHRYTEEVKTAELHLNKICKKFTGSNYLSIADFEIKIYLAKISVKSILAENKPHLIKIIKYMFRFQSQVNLLLSVSSNDLIEKESEILFKVDTNQINFRTWLSLLDEIIEFLENRSKADHQKEEIDYGFKLPGEDLANVVEELSRVKEIRELFENFKYSMYLVENSEVFDSLKKQIFVWEEAIQAKKFQVEENLLQASHVREELESIKLLDEGKKLEEISMKIIDLFSTIS
jgi:hypothetical protein